MGLFPRQMRLVVPATQDTEDTTALRVSLAQQDTSVKIIPSPEKHGNVQVISRRQQLACLIGPTTNLALLHRHR